MRRAPDRTGQVWEDVSSDLVFVVLRPSEPTPWSDVFRHRIACLKTGRLTQYAERVTEGGRWEDHFEWNALERIA